MNGEVDLNLRKVLGSLAGFVILAGVSYHQVRDDGTGARDQAIMTGTAVAGAASARVDGCGQAEAGRDGEAADESADCGDRPRR